MTLGFATRNPEFRRASRRLDRTRGRFSDEFAAFLPPFTIVTRRFVQNPYFPHRNLLFQRPTQPRV